MAHFECFFNYGFCVIELLLATNSFPVPVGYLLEKSFLLGHLGQQFFSSPKAGVAESLLLCLQYFSLNSDDSNFILMFILFVGISCSFIV